MIPLIPFVAPISPLHSYLKNKRVTPQIVTIEEISIQRTGEYYRVVLSVNGILCAFDPCCFEFWHIEEKFGSGTDKFYKVLAVKCLESTANEASYWMQNGRPSMKADRDRAINLIGQLRKDLATTGSTGMSAAA